MAILKPNSVRRQEDKSLIYNELATDTDDTVASPSEPVSSVDISVSELNLLRDLLVGDEIAELADARQHLLDIEQQIYDPERLIELMQPIIIELIKRKVDESGDQVASVIAPIIDASIQKKIEQDKSAIARTLSPIISEAIKNQIELSRDELSTILAPVISESISKMIDEATDEMAKVLAPVMGAAIKEQVRSHRDEVVDALYPVIGSTVARYIKHFFDSINRKLQNTFTIEWLKRKIKAKIKGVSEAELAFKESITFNIRAVFLIHQSGLLMTQVQPPGQPIMESEMVAGMLTAIRSFVNEWIEQSEVASEIDQIEYGTSKIILEPIGAFGYLVVVGEGEPHEQFSKQLSETSSYIGDHFSDEIKDFDGDVSKVPKEIDKTVANLIGGQLLFSIGLEFQADLNEGDVVWGDLRKISENLQNAFEDNEIALSPNATVSNGEEENRWMISDADNDQQYTIVADEKRLNVYGKQVTKSVKRYPFFIAAAAILSLIVTFLGYRIYQGRLDRNIEKKSVIALKSATDLEPYRLTVEVDGRTLKLSGMVPNAHFNERAESIVEEVVGQEVEIDNTIQVLTDPMLEAKIDRISSRLDEMLSVPSIDTRIYFYRGSSTLTSSALYKIAEVKEFLDKYPDIHLRIMGYCDFSGDLKANLQLGPKRAVSVRDALVILGVDASRLHTAGTTEPPPDVGQDQPAQLSRCVLFEPIRPRMP